MKKISYWAVAHPVYARIIIVTGHLILMAKAIAIGCWLDLLGVATSGKVPTLVMILFVVVYLLYLTGTTWRRYFSFWARKSADFLLIVLHFAALITYSNHLCSKAHRTHLQDVYSTNPTFQLVSNRTYETPFQEISPKQVKKQNRLILAGGMALWLKILLITLAVLVGLWLAAIIALLGCSIACSGNEALGTVVVILGWAGIIFSSFLFIRYIVRTPTKEKVKKAENATN
ncbi:MAG: hypothetical protein RMJ44_02135 [Cytophagales bacterium]|nr:hypothetical protein [Bernardetiaceae bacterium]MDW8209859.1 hypothetical protein [Cytophagales bacterium]